MKTEKQFVLKRSDSKFLSPDSLSYVYPVAIVFLLAHYETVQSWDFESTCICDM